MIATSSMKVYSYTGSGWEQVTATSTATAWTVSQASGQANIAFVAGSEQVVPAGQTKTYELRGTILTGGASGDTMTTKIADVASSATTTSYAEVALSSGSFIWSDKSGAGATHSSVSSDWTDDYKVPGVPTSPLSLSK